MNDLALRAPFSIQVDNGVIEYPLHHMRGGTSTGLVLWERLVPREPALREELLRHLMGVPLAGTWHGNRQTTGLGRGPATSNKVFLADLENSPDGPRLVSTLAQLASDHAGIDWSVNCGNMSSALQLWLQDMQPVTAPAATVREIAIRNTNTGTHSRSRMAWDAHGRMVTTCIPGVLGEYPAVDLFLDAPVGAKTGRLLPTGSACDDIEGLQVSCVDVAVPMVIIDAADLGKTAHEPIAELEADTRFMHALRRIWVAAGLKMALKRRDGIPMNAAELAGSETIPKVCIVGTAQAGGHIAVRYFTPQAGHASMAVSGGCCLAAATLIPGSVANRVAQGVAPCGTHFDEVSVRIENPAGILEAIISARVDGGTPEIASAAYRRSAQILMRGHVPLYRASSALARALEALRRARSTT